MKPSTDADLAALDERRRAWCDSVNGGELNRYMALLTEAAVWLPPGQAAVVGRPAIRAWLEPLFEQYRYVFSVTPEQVRVAGEVAVDKGRFSTVLTSKAEGGSLRHEGKYLLLWRRSPAGVWRIERYLDMSDLAESV